MRFPISVCMIVKNEEQSLPSCLSAISSRVEEIIIVDTGSHDRTPEVAASFGAHVFSWDWNDDFSAARNFSLSHATKPYILVLDADELLDANSLPAIESYIRSHAGRAGMVNIKNVGEDENVHQMFQLPRIFPNRPEFRYVRRIHEQLRKKEEFPETVATDILLIHNGYRDQSIKQLDKIQRNLRLLEMERLDAPCDIYVLFQLAKTHYMAQQYEQAASLFQVVVDEINLQRVTPAFLPSLFLQYAYTLLHLRYFAELFQVLEVGVELFPNYTHLYFIYGQALIELRDPNRFMEIPEVFEHCLRLGDNSAGYESAPGVGSFMAQFNLGVYYEVIGQLNRAKDYYQLAASARYSPAKSRLAALESSHPINHS